LFRTVPIPEDLASVTDIATAAEVDRQRDIAVSLMNSGKPVLRPYLKALPVLLNTISAE
jgi:hypothetical protein